MRSDAIVIVGVGFQDPTQTHLAQDNDVVHTLTPDRSDQPFGKAILRRRGRCGRLVSDAHGAQSARDDAAIDPVAIADEVVRSLIPGERLRYLTCNPFGRGICCDVDPDEVSAVEPDDDEGIEQVETDSWNNEQVHGGNVRRVVTQESPPSLAGRRPPFDHVLGDARLRDLKPELEQFAVDAWRPPKADSPCSSAGSTRAAPCRSAVALPMGATSNASSSESRPCANARASRAGRL